MKNNSDHGGIDEDYGGENDEYLVNSNDIYGEDYATNAKMMQLDNKHADTKKQVDAIKKSLGLKHWKMYCG